MLVWEMGGKERGEERRGGSERTDCLYYARAHLFLSSFSLVLFFFKSLEGMEVMCVECCGVCGTEHAISLLSALLSVPHAFYLPLISMLSCQADVVPISNKISLHMKIMSTMHSPT